MTKRLFFEAIWKVAAGIVLVAALLFLPAGTLCWPDGWLLIVILFVPMLAAGVVMMLRSPELLRRRLSARETEAEQKQVISGSAVMFLAAFLLAGLNFRFGWVRMPRWSVWTAAAVFLAAYALYAEVLRENMYLSRTVEVQEGQKVVDSGLYGIVRHPMYAVTLLLFLAMPLVLGSILSFAVMLAYVPIIVRRIANEEKVLEEGLEGYREYKNKVRYRLIPFLW